jgi:hypothetical protein
MAERGYLALAVPLVWVVVALEILRREKEFETPGLLVFTLGLLVLLVILFFVLRSSVFPLLRLLMPGCSLSA